MNAALLSKPVKGLVLASGLLIGLSTLASADTGTVSLAAQANTALASFYYNPPAGPALPNTAVPFDLSSGNFVYLGRGDSATFTTSYKNPANVYLLVNSSFTYSNYATHKAGQVTLTFSDGTTQATDLTIGDNLREWRIGAGGVVVGTTTSQYSANAWSGYAQGWMGGGAAVLDQLTVPVDTANKTKTLTGVSVNRINDGMDVHLLVSGLTVDYTTISYPGNSGYTESVEHRQNVGHSNAPKFTTGGGETASNKSLPDTTPQNNGKRQGHGRAKAE
jgi:hypothetical protein